MLGNVSSLDAVESHCSLFFTSVSHRMRTSLIKAQAVVECDMKTMKKSKTDHVAVGNRYIITIPTPTLTLTMHLLELRQPRADQNILRLTHPTIHTHTQNAKEAFYRNAQSTTNHPTHLKASPSSQPQTMSFWQSYRNLHPRTRLFIGGGLVAYAAFGLMASDQIEQYLGWTATEEDRKRLPQVHMVDRREK